MVGGLPPTPTVESTLLPTLAPEAAKESTPVENEVEEAAPRVDETFAMTEEDELNDDLSGYSEEGQDLESYEFVPDPPFVRWFSVQNILLVGGMILSALIAILALLAAFRSRNRF